ncbi:kinase-like domain-containing protein [Rhizophagus clarus]|uniref:Kinase-like domain-containing protein n=1 Tax=Rhizophagus clarus TaxID=94130 RepID=A0A8H3LWE5_9GLOM|nr:kinase-like domain-containing protein [Rhizophagus clarus]
MELISAKGKHSFDPTPRLKSSPVPILFIPFNYVDKCNYCKSKFSRTSTFQLYCKNCLFDYVSKLTYDNMYLDVHIRTEETQCIEHEPRNLDFYTQNIQEWCRNCSEISHFNQIVTEYLHHNRLERYKCKLCGYETESRLCPNCYLIYSEFIELTLNGEPIPIVYLPWWDVSSNCLCCRSSLIFKSDCQKWCSRCFTIFSGCRYCLTTNIIIGITEQSNCGKCIDTAAIYKKNIFVFTRINFSKHHHIVNCMNNIDQKSLYKILGEFGKFQFQQFRQFKHHTYPTKTNGQIRFLLFDNNENKCDHCGNSYFSTLLFEQKYCKYCLYWYIKEQTDKNVYLDVLIINTTNICCTKHETRNLGFHTQNIQEWYLPVPLPEKILSEASQKWCSNCFTIYVGCKYCITTNIIFGLANQSQEYSTTLLFNQRYCKYCLYWYIKFTKPETRNIDVRITTSNTQCTDHISRNLDFYTENIQEWCINCSEILYFGQLITDHLIDMGYYKIQDEISKYEKDYKLQKFSLNNTEFEWRKSNSTKKSILILYLPWWDAFSNCMACRKNLECISTYQKWCMHCFIIYNGCRYCLTTNVIFGFINQSQCLKCKRTSFINIDGNLNIDELLNSTIDISDEISNYIINNVDKGSTNNPLKIYDFVKDKLEIIRNIKIIKYSETDNFRKIAEGGFGIIYGAIWKISSVTKKTVAVKRFINSQKISKDFINELKSFNQYHNKFEHIIKYFGITQDPNTKEHMIIMQYADGGDLHNYLQKKFKNITWKEKLSIILEISRGVHCIHKENFIHRDLHSGNILLIKGKWHIGGFGLSRPANIASSNNEIYGVIPYVAPEIFKGGTFSKESDIYSMGMVLPHMKEIRKAIVLWIYMIKDILHSHVNLTEKIEVIEEFNQAEKTRLKLVEEKILGPEFTTKIHPGAVYTSRSLNSLISNSSTNNLEYISIDLEFDINDAKGSSLPDLNSKIPNSNTSNTQYPNMIYDSIPSNESILTKQEYISKEFEFDINKSQWSPPDVNSLQNSSSTQHPVNSSRKRKIAEVKTETQRKLVKTNVDLQTS